MLSFTAVPSCLLAVLLGASTISTPEVAAPESQQLDDAAATEPRDLSPEDDLTADEASTAACSCPGGVMCDDTPIVGACGQKICGKEYREYQCRRDGWFPLPHGCKCQ